MSVATDLERNERAAGLADKMIQWIACNRSIRMMEDGTEEILRCDHADRVYYIQKNGGTDVRFGHIIMRQGRRRTANAAVVDFRGEQGIHWVLCAVSNHPDSIETELALHVTNTTFVHEATHYLDFTRTNYKPAPFKESHSDKASTYYATPHEYNAFFHEGLYGFKRDLAIVGQLDSRLILRHLMNDAYWPVSFVNSLSQKYRRKLIRRYSKIYHHLMLPEGAPHRCGYRGA